MGIPSSFRGVLSGHLARLQWEAVGAAKGHSWCSPLRLGCCPRKTLGHFVVSW